MEILAEHVDFGAVCGGEIEAKKALIVHLNKVAPEMSEKALNCITWGFNTGYSSALNSVINAIRDGKIKITLFDENGFEIGIFWPVGENIPKWG